MFRTHIERRALPVGGRRSAARAVAAAAVGAAVLLLFPGAAGAGPGSGTASILATTPVVAGSRGIWTITYTATEDFAYPVGGVVEIEMPAGWTPPQRVSNIAAGWVNPSDTTTFIDVSSIQITGQTVRMLLGDNPRAKFIAGSALSLVYGQGGGGARPFAQTNAPATATFQVRSDPDAGNGVNVAAIGTSPSLSVVPDVVTHIRVVDATLAPVGALLRTTDQDTSHFFLRGYDQFDNSARFVSGAWSVTGGLGSVSPTAGDGTVLTLTVPGTGYVAADSGAWADSTGLITVLHGAYVALAMTSAPTAVAGSSFVASVEARDADGNRNTSGAGASAALRIVAYEDSLGATPADPDLVDDTQTLSFGFWSGTLTPRNAGAYFLAARDTVSGLESSPRRRVDVAPAPPDRIVLYPDTLRLVAGDPDTVTVVVYDVFGNRTPVLTGEELTLWTDRPQGEFQDLSGVEIFTLTIPAGTDSADFRFVDTRSTTTEGRVRAIDANGVSPFLGTAGVPVYTVPNLPAGSIALAAASDTLVADGADSSHVTSGVVRDAYGNAIPEGERFTVTATGASVVTDDDAVTPGAQWTAASDGTLNGWVRAGTAKGAAGVDAASEQGSASGSVALTLIAGAPSGSIALVADPDSLAADSVSVRSITATGLVDANGNPVEDGESYTVATTLGAIATPDADGGEPGVQALASGGALTLDLFGGDVLGTATVTATSVRGASSGSVDVRLVPGNASASRSTVTATSPVPVGAPGSTVTVTLRDAQDHPLAAFPSDSISLSISGVPATLTPLAPATDALGALDFSAVSNTAGAATASASIPSRGIALDDEPGAVFEPGPLDHYSVSTPAGPYPAGVAAQFQVSARDAFENLVPAGHVLRPSVAAGAASVPDSVMLSGGQAVVDFTPTLAGALAIEVADDSSRTVTFGPTTVAAGAPWRAVASPPGTATLSAGDSTTVVATLFDQSGNPIPGGTLASSVVSGGGDVSPGSVPADGSGQATFTLRAGGVPGVVAYRLYAPGSAADDSIAADTVLVSVSPGAAASVVVVNNPALIAAGEYADVELTLLDAFGNVAAAATPTLWLRTTSALPDSVSWALGPGAFGGLSDSISGDGASYAFAAADSGTATLRIRATKEESFLIRASGSGLPLAESGTHTITPAAPASVAILSGDGQTAVVSRALALPLRVVVRDDFGNPTPGAQILFRVAAGNGSVDAVAGGGADSVVSADGLGVATCDVARVGTAAGAGNHSFRAGLLLDPAVEVFFTASATPDTAVSLAVAPGSFSLPAGQTATVTVTAEDAFGNAVPGASVTVYLGTPVAGSLESLGATSGSGATQAGPADAAGQVAVRYRAPNAAPAADSIFARGVTIAPVGIRATVGTAAIASLEVLPDATTWTAGGPSRVLVRALDAFGNVALGDTATIVMGATDAVSFSPAWGPLVAGEIETFATATLADTLRVTAVTAGGSPSAASGPIAVIAAAAHRLIAAAPAADTLAAGDSVAVAARVFDAFGNTVAATAVAASVVAGGGSVVPPSDATDASGDAGFMLRAGGTPGTVTLRLLASASAADDSVRADSITVVVTPGGAASVEIVAGADSVVAGDLLDVILTLRDAFGNVAAAATPTLWLRTTSALPDSVSWALGPGASGTLSDSASGDGASYTFAAADAGVASLRVRGTRAETIRLRASGTGLPLDESQNVAVTAAAAAAIALVSGDGQTAAVDQALTQPLRVLVRDVFGNPVPGAGVVYRVAAGNGSVDAVAGGSPDSVAVTDAAGVAACDVARVGTAAGSGNNSFRAGLALDPGVEVFFTASATPGPAAALTLSPGSFSIAASQTGNVVVTARDAFGNAVPGTSVTVYLGTPVAGSLESLGATSGSGATQAGPADAAGQVAVRYRAPNTAPAADSIFARGVTIAPVGIRATVGTAAIASLEVLPDATTWTAGGPSRVLVRALDAFGNVALGDTATIVMGATDAVSFSPAWGPLVAGEIESFATATLADTLVVTASTASSAVSDSAGPITVVPAAPAGAIPAMAARTELTADGRSATTVTFGPVKDAYGNVVPAGTLLTVTAQAGSLLAADASPAPGLQIATSADDSARAVLTAPATAGADTVRAVSVAGSALGAVAVMYVPPPSLAYGAGSLAPGIVGPGQTISYRIHVRNTNTGGGTVTLGTSSVFSFGAGAEACSAAVASPLALGPGVADTLRFTATVVSTSLTPATYAPSLRLVGTDGTGEPFDFYLSLAGAQVHVAGVSVLAGSAAPNPVPLGHGNLSLTFDVENEAAIGASIDGASLQFTQGAFTVNSISPPIPAPLPALGTITLTVSVTVPAGGIPSGSIVGARLTASAAFGAVTVSGENAASLDFQVVSAATLVAQSAGTSPTRYLRGRTFGPAARVANSGTAAVTLDRAQSRLVIERGPSDSLIAPLSADAVVNGGGAADLAFDSLTVPPTAAKGRYNAWLVLRGSEAGQAFAATIPLDPDSVHVVDPAFLAVTGTVTPATVSAGQTRSLSATVSNTGDVPFVLDAGTRLSLDAPVSTLLAPAALDTIPAQGSLTVTFGPAPIGSAASPGVAQARLEARGTEDGRFRAETLSAGTLDARAPAALAVVAGSTTPDTLRAGQTYTMAVTIENTGGSPFVVDPPATRLVITDGVESIVALATGAAFSLAPSAQAALTFPSADVPAALASQSYPVRLFVHGTEWGLSDSASVASPADEVRVFEQVAAVQVRGLDPGAPVQAAAEDSAVRLWTLEVQPLISTGGAGSLHLEEIRFTVRVDGSPAANPAAAVSQITLRDAQGLLVGQAAPAGGNPAALTLSAPVALTGPAVPITVEVTLRPGTDASSVALGIELESDVTVRDDASAIAVSVRAPGGFPFVALTSPTVTLFAKAHGYPNPFRAGRQAVLLAYRLAADASVHVSIYTLLGDLVRELSLPAGSAGGARGLNEVPWDGRNGKGDLVRPGVYVARIEGGGVNEQIKVGVLR